jgi:peptide/nickel transport system substrate-binding protein
MSPSGVSPTARRVSRRQLLRIGLALAALPLAAACGQQQPAAPAPTAKPAESKPAESKPAAPAATTAPAEAAKPAPAATQAAPAAATKAGAGGSLKMLLWQGPTILNPHIATGTKDSIAARCCLEPLLTVGLEGKFEPVLAAEVPSKENNGLSADGKSVTYQLKKDVKWADGAPFTADDVAFTFEFIKTPESSATSVGTYDSVDKVEAVDPLTVRITFKEPTGGWYQPFVGFNGMILPKHIMKDFVGARSREAPLNTKALGTGPYMVEDFKPGDLVIYKPNPNYRDAGKIAFSQIEMKGGGDAPSAARAVFQTGEYDYSWNLQVEWQVLEDIMKGGKGDLVTNGGSGVEQIWVNFADPNTEVDGERGHPSTRHPFLTDIKVREAMALAIDRETIAKQLYGESGEATPNVLTTPDTLASKNTKFEFNIDKANKVLDDAGYRRGGDGIRVSPQGVRLKVLFVTSINSLRQKEQAIVKDGWQKIGIETELKSVDANIYFGGSPDNPDTLNRFQSDVQMFTSTFDSPAPVGYMNRFYTKDKARNWAQKSNNWSGRNFVKWESAEYDQLFDQALVETDIEKAAQMWQKLNDLAVNNYVSIPLINRKFAEGKAKSLQGVAPRPFDVVSWNIADWKKG